MGKRLDKSIKPAVDRELTKRKILKLKIGGDDYEVRIKYVLTSQDKAKILEDMSEMMLSESILQNEMAAFTIATCMNITDVDFGEDMEERLQMLGLLSDGGYLEQIFDNIPQKTLEDLMEFLKTTADILPEFVKEAQIEELKKKETREE